MLDTKFTLSVDINRHHATIMLLLRESYSVKKCQSSVRTFDNKISFFTLNMSLLLVLVISEPNNSIFYYAFGIYVIIHNTSGTLSNIRFRIITKYKHECLFMYIHWCQLGRQGGYCLSRKNLKGHCSF